MRTPGVLSRRPVRLRLALLYSGLFLLAGAALLAGTYGLVADTLRSTVPPQKVTAITQSSGPVESLQGKRHDTRGGRGMQTGGARGRAGHRQRDGRGAARHGAQSPA